MQKPPPLPYNGNMTQRSGTDIRIRTANGGEMLRLWGEAEKEASPTARFFAQNIECGNAVFWAAERDGALIGELYAFFALEDFDFADGKTTAYLCAFRVQAAFRGKGIGTRLMETALADLKARGIVSATIGADEAQNVARYRRMGFTETVKTCYADPCDRDEAMQPIRVPAGYVLLRKTL